jgi:hypothetical protein
MDPSRYPSQKGDGYPYQVAVSKGHVYYAYPPGGVLLIAPAVWVMNLCGYSSHDGNWLYEPSGDLDMQNLLAPLVTALFVAFVYLTASKLLPGGAATGLTLVAAFGTMAFSTASRGLWSDTWGIVLLQGALLVGASEPKPGRDWQGGALGTLMAWLVFARPTYATALLVVCIWLLKYRRSWLPGFCLAGVCWLVLFAAFLKWQTGSVLPMYSSQGGMITWLAIPEALPGHLFSPSRGLMTMVPVLWFVVWIAVRHRSIWSDELWRLAIGGFGAHLALISCWPIWWGGHCFGPRLVIGALPFLVLAGILAMKEWWPRRGIISGTLVVLLSAISIFIHSVGAFSPASWAWNARPETIHATPEDMWDWRYPQYLAGVLPMPLPREFPPLPADGKLNPGEEIAGRYLVRGWSGGEGHWRWSEAKNVKVVFTRHRATKLHLTFYPFLGQGRIPSQQVTIRANGDVIFDKAIDSEWQGYAGLALPLAEDGRYHLDIQLPNAASPASFGAGYDDRPLGIRLEHLAVE